MQLGPCSKTYNCVLVVGYATSAPPRTTKIKIELQPSYKTCSYDQVTRHVVACLVWRMQLGPICLGGPAPL